MKFGIRTPNVKKRLKARTTGKLKRAVKKSFNPVYGKKGVGMITNPKKAMYNKVYNKTTVSVDNLIGKNNKVKGSNGGKNTNCNKKYDRYSTNDEIKKQSILFHIFLFCFTYGIGNIIYVCKISNHNKKVRSKIKNQIQSQIKDEKVAFKVNQLAMNLEKMGQIEDAVEKYKEAIELGFNGSYPFDRLNVYYRKQKDYDNEILNCEKAIKLFEDMNVATGCDISGKILKYKERRERALLLKKKE